MGKGKKRQIIIIAVHKYETWSGKHEVDIIRGKKVLSVKRFSKWSNAEKYAKKKAVEMGLKSIIVDTPRRPHIEVKVKAPPKKTKRTTKRKVKRRRRRSTLPTLRWW